MAQREIPFDVVELDFQTTHDLIKLHTDARFRLLALLPPLSTVAVAIVSAQTLGPVSPAAMAAIGLLGFSIILAIVLYDLRNSEFYNALIHRAKLLERLMGSMRTGAETLEVRARAEGETRPAFSPDDAGGPYSQRPPRTEHFLASAVSHGSALSLVYAVVLASWLFPITKGIAVLVGPFIKDRWTLPWTPTGTGTTTTLLAFIIAIGGLLLFRRRLANIDKQAGAKSIACYPRRQVGG